MGANIPQDTESIPAEPFSLPSFLTTRLGMVICAVTAVATVIGGYFGWNYYQTKNKKQPVEEAEPELTLTRSIQRKAKGYYWHIVITLVVIISGVLCYFLFIVDEGERSSFANLGHVEP